VNEIELVGLFEDMGYVKHLPYLGVDRGVSQFANLHPPLGVFLAMFFGVDRLKPSAECKVP
jgi:hypothetical protein